MTQYCLPCTTTTYNETPGRSQATNRCTPTSTRSTRAIQEDLVFGGGLEAPHTATVVAERDGQLVMTDGPYAETKEAVGGFWVIEAPDLDAALEHRQPRHRRVPRAR